MRSQGLFSIRCTALLVLLLCVSNARALDVSPSPSTDGSYVVSWGTTLGCFIYDDYSYYCYWLEEDGIAVSTSGNSLPVSGKPPGTYTYCVRYVFFFFGAPYEELVVEGPVAVTVVDW